MDLSASSNSLAGRTNGSESGPVTGFDPSDPGAAVELSQNPKEYGCGFDSGFLRYLDSGEFSDVVVDVIAEAEEEAGSTGNVASPKASCNETTAPKALRDVTSTICGERVVPFDGSSSSSSAPPPKPPVATRHRSLCNSYSLHGLLLARHSAFFAAALGQQHFADSAARRIRLTLDPAAAPEWPTLVRYFYTDRVRLDDSNALPLLALARQLLVPELDSFCTGYVRGRLCAGNCISHLRASVRFALHDLHTECVELAAQSFPVLYDSDLSGLPPASLLEILMHPLLQVHCELQVVVAITRYLATTVVDTDAVRALCAQIRFPYLDNATITRLAAKPSAVLLASAYATGGMATAGASKAVAQSEGCSGSSVEGCPTAADCTAGDRSNPTQTSELASDDSTIAVQPASGPSDPLPDAAAGGGSNEVAPVAQSPSPLHSIDSHDRSRLPLKSVSAGASPSASDASLNTDGSKTPAAVTRGGGNGGEHRDVGSAIGRGLPRMTGHEGGGGLPRMTGHEGGGGLPRMTGHEGGGGDDDDDCSVRSLLTASISAGSSPDASAGGAGTPTHGSSGAIQHDRLPPSASCCSEPRSGAAGPLQSSGRSHPQHPQHQQPLQIMCPLVPRDMALEGALARLAAMEFHSSQGQSSAGAGSCSSATALAGPAAGNNSAAHGVYHSYVQHSYLYTSAAATSIGVAGPATALLDPAAAAAAAAGGSDYRQLAAFRAFPGPMPLYGGIQAARVPYSVQMAPGATGLQHHHQHPVTPVHPAASLREAMSCPAVTAAGAGTPKSGHGDGGSRREDGSQQGTSCDGDFAVVDAASALAGCFLPRPRPSYCCNVVHGLPGGCAWVDVALEVLWEHLVPYITVKASGCGEGRLHHVVADDPDCYFETNDSLGNLPWVEIQLPHNVHVLNLHRYTFLHGHRRAGYYRARNFKTQIAVRPGDEPRLSTPPTSGDSGAAAVEATGAAATNAAGGGAAGAAGAAGPGQRQRQAQGRDPETAAAALAAAPATRYLDVTTRMVDQFDVGILSGASAAGPWRVLRLQATGAQEDGVHRLCIRGLRMYGIARVDLMRQANGFVVQPHRVVNARVEHGGGGGSGVGVGHGAGGGGGSMMTGWSSWT